MTASPKVISSKILNWYDRHARRLPWRALPGEEADPYRVWLSEIMLQQTTVATVGPYFDLFTRTWPKVTDLAAAPQEEVLTAWAGLGYYARARNLHKCAQVVAADHGGLFPADEAALLSLPGIGPYTAAAVAAIAFNLPSAPVDGNIERVISRLYALRDPLPGVKKAIKEKATELTFPERPGDQAQALMDLGAGVCTPRKPKCLHCPLRDDCQALSLGIAEDLPVKAPKKVKPTRRGQIFWLTRSDGSVLLRRRAEKGLLGGMMEFPSTPWLDKDPGATSQDAPQKELAGDVSSEKAEAGSHDAEDLATSLALPAAFLPQDMTLLPGQVKHTFTHFHLELQVHKGQVRQEDLPPDCRWVAFEALGNQALPTVMVKVIKHLAAQRD
ncbi:A/G-specific adenine glycosylase [Rhodovibrionaceae bacterium A322]